MAQRNQGVRLPNLRETAEHDWDGVVGQTGLREFVLIDETSPELTLLVTPDD